MANNIYIGNRYVPVFANPVEWDNLREYEPLTIVTYQGTAYTSKKTVPVGTALSNTDYWVVTGNYNAQVEQYRQEVADLSDDVATMQPLVEQAIEDSGDAKDGVTALTGRFNTLSDDYNGCKDLIVIGDSWTKGYIDGTNFYSWTKIIEDAGLFENVYVAASLDAPGFIHGTTFRTHFDNIHAEHPDVKNILICGGVNDGIGTNTNLIIDAAISLFNHIRDVIPDAKLYYVINCHYNKNGDRVVATPTKLSDINLITDAISRQGVKAMVEPYYSVDYDLNFWSDGLHLTEVGYKQFGIAIMNGLINNKFTVYAESIYNNYSQTYTLADGSVNITQVVDVAKNGDVHIMQYCNSAHNATYMTLIKNAYFPKNSPHSNFNTISVVPSQSGTTLGTPMNVSLYFINSYDDNPACYILSNGTVANFKACRYHLYYNIFEPNKPIEFRVEGAYNS